MKVRRHAFLYDIDRWRRYRLPMFLLATAFLIGSLLSPHPKSGANPAATILSLAGAALYGFAANFWLRQRYSTLSVEDDTLVAKRIGMTMRIPLADVKRARVARVSATANRPERRRTLPRPQSRWLETDAITLRLDMPADQLVKLGRLLGRGYLFESDLVAPVSEQDDLLREIEEGMPRPEPPQPTGRRRRRR